MVTLPGIYSDACRLLRSRASPSVTSQPVTSQMLLDGLTGNVLWDATVEEPKNGYSITLAPPSSQNTRALLAKPRA